MNALMMLLFMHMESIHNQGNELYGIVCRIICDIEACCRGISLCLVLLIFVVIGCCIFIKS